MFISHWNFFIIQLKHLSSAYTFSIIPSQHCILPNRNNKWFDRNSGSHCSFWLIPHVGVLFYLLTKLYLFSNVINNRNATNSNNIQSKLIISQNRKLFNLVLIFSSSHYALMNHINSMNHKLKNFLCKKILLIKFFRSNMLCDSRSKHKKIYNWVLIWNNFFFLWCQSIKPNKKLTSTKSVNVLLLLLLLLVLVLVLVTLTILLYFSSAKFITINSFNNKKKKKNKV